MVTLTEEAKNKVSELLSHETEDMALRVAVRPGGCSGFSYEMYFDTDKAEDDVEKLFETFEEIPSFEPKNKDSLVKDSKSDIETVSKVKNINDHFSKNLSIDLNDRLAFIKNLFDGDTKTYDKVLSQIVTFESWAEVSTFLETQVKIEYNDWNDKEEIAKRFSTILKKHFDF